MGARRTPQEKKRLSLKKDHPLVAEYPHAFRKSWPKKKRRAQRTFRRKTKQALDQGKGPIDPAAEEWVDSGGIRRKPVNNWGAPALGEVIKRKKIRRIESYRRKKKVKAARAAFGL